MKQQTDSRTVATTVTSLTVLEAIKEEEGTTLTQLTEELQMAKSTVHAHLSTLQSRGYVVKSGNQYDVSLKLLELGEYAKRRQGLYDIAQQKVNELANRTNLEADFLVYERGQMVLLYGEIGNSGDNNFPPGTHYHMHSTGTGKAILAQLEDSKVERILDQWGLPAITDHTITSRDELLAELETVREQGYGVNDQECLTGYQTIGTEIRNPMGKIIGGLGVGGAVYRVDEEVLFGETATTLLETAEEFESRLHSTALPE